MNHKREGTNCYPSSLCLIGQNAPEAVMAKMSLSPLQTARLSLPPRCLQTQVDGAADRIRDVLHLEHFQG